MREPSFENQIATLELDGRSALLRVERPVERNGSEPELVPVFDYELASSTSST